MYRMPVSIKILFVSLLILLLIFPQKKAIAGISFISFDSHTLKSAPHLYEHHVNLDGVDLFIQAPLLDGKFISSDPSDYVKISSLTQWDPFVDIQIRVFPNDPLIEIEGPNEYHNNLTEEMINFLTDFRIQQGASR